MSLAILFALVTGNVPPTYLNPYIEPIREKEVRKYDPRENLPTPIEPTDPEFPEMEIFRNPARMNFLAVQMGYAYSATGAQTPQSPTSQMQIEGEFGLRRLEKWDFGVRVASQLLSGQSSIYGGLTGHLLTRFGQWILFGQLGYRSSYETSSGRMSPVLGFGYRRWTPNTLPASQWVLSPQLELDFGGSGVRVVMSILIGQDWQW